MAESQSSGSQRVTLESSEQAAVREAGDTGISNPEDVDRTPVPASATDVGVTSLEGDPKEPQGPEDALGAGPKRGDYRGRVPDPDVKQHYETIPVPDAKPGEPQYVAVLQNPRATDQGNPDKEHKGGVSGPAHDKAIEAETKKAAQAAAS